MNLTNSISFRKLVLEKNFISIRKLVFFKKYFNCAFVCILDSENFTASISATAVVHSEIVYWFS